MTTYEEMNPSTLPAGFLDDGAHNDDPPELNGRRPPEPDPFAFLDEGDRDVRAKANIDLGKFVKRSVPAVPEGVDLPMSVRPALERYDRAEANLDAALAALEAAYRDVVAAKVADRRAKKDAARADNHHADEGLPAMSDTAAAEWVVREREEDAQAYLEVVEERATAVNQAIAASALEMRNAAIAELATTAEEGAAAVTRLESAVAHRARLLATVDLIDRTYMLRNVDLMTVIDAPRPADLPADARYQPPEVVGQLLSGTLRASCAEQIQNGKALRLKDHRKWFGSEPDAVHPATVATLAAAYRGPDAPEEPSQPARRQRAKAASSKG